MTDEEAIKKAYELIDKIDAIEEKKRLEKLNQRADWEAQYTNEYLDGKPGDQKPRITMEDFISKENLDKANKELNQILDAQKEAVNPGEEWKDRPNYVFADRKPTYACLFRVSWGGPKGPPRIAIFLGLLRLPYDLVRFCILGRADFVAWPWRW